MKCWFESNSLDNIALWSNGRILAFEVSGQGSMPCGATYGVFSLTGKVTDCESVEQGSRPEYTQRLIMLMDRRTVFETVGKRSNRLWAT